MTLKEVNKRGKQLAIALTCVLSNEPNPLCNQVPIRVELYGVTVNQDKVVVLVFSVIHSNGCPRYNIGLIQKEIERAFSKVVIVQQHLCFFIPYLSYVGKGLGEKGEYMFNFFEKKS